MFKKVLFQLHWFFGITAGLVLSVMGITGALYAFEDELMHLINRDVEVSRTAERPLPPAELASRLEARTGKPIAILSVDIEGDDPARVWFKPPPGERRGEMRNFNPYDGELLGDLRGEGFFSFVLMLHRFLAVGETGKQITAASTIALIFFCLSGLYLRWPRQALNWRAWLTLDWAKKGRAFNWDLHAVFGTWCLLFYLIMALTGLYWSYEWYNRGMVKLMSDDPAADLMARGSRPGPGQSQPATAPNLAAIWDSLQRETGDDLRRYNVRLPQGPGQQATVYYLLKSGPHDRAINQMSLDPASGQVTYISRYADKSLSNQLLISNYAVHTGSYFGLPGRVIWAAAALTMPLFFVTGLLLYFDRRRKKRQVAAARGEVAQGIAVADGAEWLVGFASQSGFAEQLAWQTAGQLQSAGLPVRVQRLADVTEQDLNQSRNALFVISTFGDGEAPDSARGFERKLLGRPLSLENLNYAVLALGDRQYQHFCGFARRLQAWLTERGGSSLFSPVEVDGTDGAALARWQQQLGQLTGGTPSGNWQAPAYEGWTLASREWLNPGSVGSKVFLLGLTPPSAAPWEAGDLVEVLPRNGLAAVEQFIAGLGVAADTPVVLNEINEPLDVALASRQLPANRGHLVGLHAQALVDALVPLAMREYSIASITADGVLELIVRQEKHPDGTLGLGSGWLTEHAPLGTSIAIRLRRNSGFHRPADPVPLILIGNGTGLAGLRSLLKARIADGQSRNWLLYGERNAAYDFHCGDELKGWLANGDLARLDLAFSRDQQQRIYVQDRLREAGETLRQWLNDGAAIYICGSLEGMAAGVDAVLIELLGAEAVAELIEQGRYRRDVY